MKINIEEKESNEELAFPCLMIGESGNILFATSSRYSLLTGTIIYVSPFSSAHIPGDFSRSWISSKFKKFTGKITLEND